MSTADSFWRRIFNSPPKDSINKAEGKQLDALEPPKKKKQKSHVTIWPSYTKEK
jgi:hypothetical protein